MQKGIYNCRVELGAALVLDLSECLFKGPGLLVNPGMGESIEQFVEYARGSSHSAPFCGGEKTDPFAPSRASFGPLPNLPARTPFSSGHKEAVASPCSTFDAHGARLLTIIAPRGTSRTHIAAQVAASYASRFPDGVHHIELTATCNPDLLLAAIAQALDLRETRDQSLLQELNSYLSDKRLLLILDNFEQVAPAAPLLSEILGANPWLKIVVTSNEALRLYGEHIFHVSDDGRP